MKRDELDTILHLIKIGFTKEKIRKKLNLSVTSLSNRLRQLEDLGLIKRIGKYEIKILPSSSNHPKVTKIPISKKLNKRGHAHNFKVIFPSEEDMRKNIEVLKYINRKPQINKKTGKLMKIRNPAKVLNNGCISFRYKNYTIWINKESLTLYSKHSYYSSDALHSKFMALKDTDNLIKYFKQRFSFKGVYGVEVFREHYGLIFNQFAEWLLDRGGKLDIKNKGNKSILWVDDSKKDDIGLKEFEGTNPLSVNKADERFFKEHEETNWEWSPKVIAKKFNNTNQMINKVTQNQIMFNNNFKSHIEAIRTLSQTVKELKEEVKNLKNARKNI